MSDRDNNNPPADIGETTKKSEATTSQDDSGGPDDRSEPPIRESPSAFSIASAALEWDPSADVGAMVSGSGTGLRSASSVPVGLNSMKEVSNCHYFSGPPFDLEGLQSLNRPRSRTKHTQTPPRQHNKLTSTPTLTVTLPRNSLMISPVLPSAGSLDNMNRQQLTPKNSQDSSEDETNNDEGTVGNMSPPGRPVSEGSTDWEYDQEKRASVQSMPDWLVSGVTRSEIEYFNKKSGLASGSGGTSSSAPASMFFSNMDANPLSKNVNRKNGKENDIPSRKSTPDSSTHSKHSSVVEKIKNKVTDGERKQNKHEFYKYYPIDGSSGSENSNPSKMCVAVNKFLQQGNDCDPQLRYKVLKDHRDTHMRKAFQELALLEKLNNQLLDYRNVPRLKSSDARLASKYNRDLGPGTQRPPKCNFDLGPGTQRPPKCNFDLGPGTQRPSKYNFDLGSEARRLLKDSRDLEPEPRRPSKQYRDVGPEARRLLKDSRDLEPEPRRPSKQYRDVGPEARRLLKDSRDLEPEPRRPSKQYRDVGPEARRLLKDSRDLEPEPRRPSKQYRDVVPEAWRLLKDSRDLEPEPRRPSKQYRDVGSEARCLLKDSRDLEPEPRRPSKQNLDLGQESWRPSKQDNDLEPEPRRPSKHYYDFEREPRRPSKYNRDLGPGTRRPSKYNFDLGSEARRLLKDSRNLEPEPRRPSKQYRDVGSEALCLLKDSRDLEPEFRRPSKQDRDVQTENMQPKTTRSEPKDFKILPKPVSFFVSVPSNEKDNQAGPSSNDSDPSIDTESTALRKAFKEFLKENNPRCYQNVEERDNLVLDRKWTRKVSSESILEDAVAKKLTAGEIEGYLKQYIQKLKKEGKKQEEIDHLGFYYKRYLKYADLCSLIPPEKEKDVISLEEMKERTTRLICNDYVAQDKKKKEAEERRRAASRFRQKQFSTNLRRFQIKRGVDVPENIELGEQKLI